jgi:hypothetical protein
LNDISIGLNLLIYDVPVGRILGVAMIAWARLSPNLNRQVICAHFLQKLRYGWENIWRKFVHIILLNKISSFFTEIRGAASNSAYYGYPNLWILRYPAHRYHAVPSPGLKPTTLWLWGQLPNGTYPFGHDAHNLFQYMKSLVPKCQIHHFWVNYSMMLH